MGLSYKDVAKMSDSAQKQILGKLQKQSKYHAHTTIIDGIKFPSQKEANRWKQLCIMERAGQIRDLKRQVRYTLIPKCQRDDGTYEKPCEYIADFVYIQDGKEIVEDTKGFKTKEYIIKRKMMLWVKNITIHEV